MIFGVIRSKLMLKRDHFYANVAQKSPRITQACPLEKVHNKPLKNQTTTFDVRFEKAHQNHNNEIVQNMRENKISHNLRWHM